MKILANRKIGTGFTIHGECVMMDKDGKVYDCIDNKYHPNPGTESDGYSEIERTIDWLFRHEISEIQHRLHQWIRVRVANYLNDFGDSDISDVIINIMYCDKYTISIHTETAILFAYEQCSSNSDVMTEWLKLDELDIARQIVTFLNENFLRIRAGGKLNPQGTNSIYFRISSHGYNWRKNIQNFLLDVFDRISDMPKDIWVVHDAETNPPEKILFRGSAIDLFDAQGRVILASRHKWD